MSVRSLPTCLIPAALLTAALLTDILAPRPRLLADDGPACPACKECLNQACTAKSACAEKMETRTYAVADLVVPCGNACGATPVACPRVAPPPACTTAAVPSTVVAVGSAELIPAPKPQAVACASTTCAAVPAPPRAANVQLCPTPQACEKELIKLIVHTVAPETWEAKGGKGTIDYFPTAMSLVVRQTPAVQEQVADLLSALRRLHDVEVALEVRFVTVSEGFCERIGIDFECNQTTEATASCPKECPAADNGKVVFLNDKQVYRFLEGVQGDQRTNVMQAPKLTMLNGQCGSLDVTDTKSFVTGLTVRQVNGDVVCVPQNEVLTTGLQMHVQPVVSADRRFVRVALNANLSDLDSPEADLIPVAVSIAPKGAVGKADKPVVFTQFIQKPRLHKTVIDSEICIPEGGTAVLNGGKRVREFRTTTLSKIPYVNRLFKNVGYARETEQLLVLVTPRVIVSEEAETRAGFEELEEMCGDWSEEPLKCGTAGCCTDCCKDKAGVSAPVRAAVKVLDPHSPNGFRDILITVEEQGTGSSCVGTCVTSQAGFTGSIVVNEHNYGFTTCEVAGLLEKYHKACAEGRHAEATALAVKALALDPSCFHKAAGCKGDK